MIFIKESEKYFTDTFRDYDADDKIDEIFGQDALNRKVSTTQCRSYYSFNYRQYGKEHIYIHCEEDGTSSAPLT